MCAHLCQLGAAVFSMCPPPACSVAHHTLGGLLSGAVGTQNAPCQQNQVLRKSYYYLNFSAFLKTKFLSLVQHFLKSG